MKRIIFFLGAVLLAAGAYGQANPLLQHRQVEFLGQLLNVSTAGANDGDVLGFKASVSGWRPVAAPNLGGTSDNQVLFNDGGTIGGQSELTWDGVDLKIEGTLNPTLRVERTNSGAAWVEMVNTSNLWGFYINGVNFGVEPEVAEGRFEIRSQGNDDLFTVQTASGIVEIEPDARLRVTGQDGDNVVNLAGFDSSNDLNTVTLGAGLSITGGTLAVTTDAGDIDIVDLENHFGATSSEGAHQETGRYMSSRCFMRLSGGSTSFTSGTPEKIDNDTPGTTSSVLTSSDWTVANGRATYTGTITHDFLVMVTIGTSTASASDMDYFLAENGTTIGGSIAERSHAANDKGSITIEYPVTLATNDYLEVYVDGASNETVTVSEVKMAIKRW